MKQKVQKIYEIICVTCGIAFFYMVLQCFGITCPIKFITGISCLGCGMTRAWINVLKGDLSAAFSYHPLVFLPPVAVLIVWKKKKIKPWLYKGFLFTMLLLSVIVYLCRLLDESDSVVVFEPGEGIIFKVAKIFMREEYNVL